MKCLLVVAHGSRRLESNEEVVHLVEKLAAKVAGRFHQTRAAFLELAEPGIVEAIDQLVEQGATEIIVFPYFLAAGKHIAKDIPDEIDIAVKKHASVSIQVTPYLGASEGLIEHVGSFLETQLSSA